jgi:hypothetical protein
MTCDRSAFSSTNNTDHHAIIEILLKVALSTINPQQLLYKCNSLKRKHKRINNDLLITTRTPLKTEVNLGAPEGSAVHDPINVGENRRDNQEWAIQIHWQH